MPDPFSLTYELHGVRHNVEVTEGSTVLGRSEDCDIPIVDESVSRVHAVIESQNGGWSIHDRNSRNGVYINQQKVDRAELRHNDRITLGRVEILVELPREAIQLGGENDTSIVNTTINVQDFKDRLLSDSGLIGPEETPGSEEPTATVEEAEDRSAQWTIPLFSRAAEALISTPDLRDMLQTVLQLVFESLPAERGCVFLFDENKDEPSLEVRSTKSGIDDDRFVISNTILSQAIEQQNAVLVIDSFSDAALSNQQSIIMNMIRSAMCAPLYGEGRVIGLIYVDTQRVHRKFTGQHLAVLTTLAILAAVAVEQAQLREKVREEQQIRMRLERYSAPTVVDRIVRSDRGPEMFAEEVEASMLFLDLVRFTTLAEQLAPSEVTRILNSVFERFADCVFDFEGTLDKFTGDGLMAIFGAPLPQEDHAVRAVQSALKMQEQLRELNQSESQELAMRIGINSGPVLAGDIGSPRRKDYTVIGDAVNVASRLESQVAKPGQIVIGEATRDLVGDRFPLQDLGSVQVKGKLRELKAFLVEG